MNIIGLKKNTFALRLCSRDFTQHAHHDDPWCTARSNNLIPTNHHTTLTQEQQRIVVFSFDVFNEVLVVIIIQ